jgi:hypothetical protein
VTYNNGTFQVWQMVVRNHGRNSARACVAQFTFHPLPASRVTGTGLITQAAVDAGGSAAFIFLPTAWVRGHRPVEITIHPKQAQRLELCRVRPDQANSCEIKIPTEEGYGAPRIVFTGGGFEFGVTVGSDNAKPVDRYGQAQCEGGSLKVSLVDDPNRELRFFTISPPHHFWHVVPFLRPKRPKHFEKLVG